MNGALYTPAMLAAAMRLADYPYDAIATLPGARLTEARARPCGSAVHLAVILDDVGRVDRVGARVTACAVGQAACAIAFDAAAGRDAAMLRSLADGIARWLADPSAPEPDGVDLSIIRAARGATSRHGAIRLPFDALATAAA